MEPWRVITLFVGFALGIAGAVLFSNEAVMQEQLIASHVDYGVLFFPGVVLALIGFVLWGITIFSETEYGKEDIVGMIGFVGGIFWFVILMAFLVNAPAPR